MEIQEVMSQWPAAGFFQWFAHIKGGPPPSQDIQDLFPSFEDAESQFDEQLELEALDLEASKEGLSFLDRSAKALSKAKTLLIAPLIVLVLAIAGNLIPVFFPNDDAALFISVVFSAIAFAASMAFAYELAKLFSEFRKLGIKKTYPLIIAGIAAVGGGALHQVALIQHLPEVVHLR